MSRDLKVDSQTGGFLVILDPRKIVNKHLQNETSRSFAITHQGQCPHQVSLNLADPHFQGLTRFLSQSLLIIHRSTEHNKMSRFVKAGYTVQTKLTHSSLIPTKSKKTN